LLHVLTKELRSFLYRYVVVSFFYIFLYFLYGSGHPNVLFFLFILYYENKEKNKDEQST